MHYIKMRYITIKRVWLVYSDPFHTFTETSNISCSARNRKTLLEQLYRILFSASFNEASTPGRNIIGFKVFVSIC